MVYPSYMACMGLFTCPTPNLYSTSCWEAILLDEKMVSLSGMIFAAGQWQSGDYQQVPKHSSHWGVKPLYFSRAGLAEDCVSDWSQPHVNINAHSRPSIITSLDLLGSTRLLNEEPQPLPFISRFPKLSQTPLEWGPGLDTNSITHIAAGPTACA